jgi:tetratricopeptide (TPR) repeat protein
VAHSPETAGDLSDAEAYGRGWDALGALIARGHSFSGREKNVALLNLRAPGGQPRFADASGAFGLDQADDSRCVLPVDWDGDGDLDLWFANRTAPRLRFFRNDQPPPPRWIAFTASGRRANRDAIGLRIELRLTSADGTSRRLWRSLRAGDSFLSQSPKILHFAFRADETIERIDFRWPAPGTPQSLAALEPNAHYAVVETDGPAPEVVRFQAEPAPRLDPPPAAAAENRGPTVRARLLDRVPLPALEYYTFDGEKRLLSDFVTAAGAEAVLVLAQGSWCATCKKEMTALATHADEVRAAGLRILALAVDAATPEATKAEVAAARQFVDDLPWPFDAGLAHEGTLKGLAGVNSRTLYPERDLALPSAWLIDKAGRIAVLYRGPLEAADLLADLRGLNAAASSPAWAFPFPGKLARPLFRLTAAGMAQAWLQAGEPDQARHELTMALDSLRPQPVDRPAVRSALVETHAMLGETELAAGRPEAAATALRSALSLLPEGHAARRALAVRLWKAGDHPAAAVELDRLAASLPQSGPVTGLNELARSWRELGEPARALAVLDTAESSGQADQRTQFERSLARQAARDFAGAVADGESLLAAGVPEAGFNLAWIFATCRDQQWRRPDRALALTADVDPAAPPTLLDTRAAALAANGRFQEAVTTARRALASARASGDATTAADILRHLDRWEAGELWLE